MGWSGLQPSNGYCTSAITHLYNKVTMKCKFVYSYFRKITLHVTVTTIDFPFCHRIGSFLSGWLIIKGGLKEWDLGPVYNEAW